MRVAVIGGGIAGLSAAWALTKKHDVVLFEKAGEAGGHARTIDVPTTLGPMPADIGFLVFHKLLYPNLVALFRHLGVSRRPILPGVVPSAYFAGDKEWRPGTAASLTTATKGEQERFDDLMRSVLADSAAYNTMTIGQLLAEHSFSKDFVEMVVCPCLTMLFVTRLGSLDLPAMAVAMCFGPVPLLSLEKPLLLETTDRGSREYVNKLTKAIGEVRLDCPVEKVERTQRDVQILAGGSGERFDQVVMAVDAQTSLQLLDNPTRWEERLLGGVEYESCKAVVHTDPSVMPPNDRGWTAFTFMGAGCHPKATQTYTNYYLPHAQRWIDTDVFVTASPPDGLIDPSRVLAVQHWKHIRSDRRQFVRASEMYRIQGRRRTWHCGSHVTDAAWHESSLRSGLAVAMALGADYPFESDMAAKQSFYDMAVNHMRVVPKRAMPSLARMHRRMAPIWPYPVLGAVRKMTRREVHKRIRKRLSFGLPCWLFHWVSPLAWGREVLTRMVAPVISPLKQLEREFRTDERENHKESKRL